MTRRKIVFIAAFTVVALFVAAVHWGWLRVPHVRSERANVGLLSSGSGTLHNQPAPDFTMQSLDGRTIKLSDLRGRPVLLNFWATWCAPCKIETPWLVELYVTYQPLGLEILGVSLDDPGEQQSVRNFVKQRGMNYPVLFGTTSAADSYGGVRLMPQTFFISRDGTVVHSVIGITSKADLESSMRNFITPGN